MLRIAVQMLVGGRAKYISLVFGITATAFLVTFAASFFCGMMTRSFALIAESPSCDVWVMDPAVECDEQTIGIPSGSLERVRGIEGVRSAMPLALATADLRFPNGRFQPVQIIGVDDATLLGVPSLDNDRSPAILRTPDAVVVAEGGTSGKLETPLLAQDAWTHGAPHLDALRRPLDVGDELLVNDFRLRVAGRAAALPRFPPRPLLYMTYSNALRILPPERHRMTFVLATAAPGIAPGDLAHRIEARTGLKARSADDFTKETVWWYLQNSEDVGDVETMLAVAMLVGLGVSGVMLYLFTQDNLRYYAMLKAMGATHAVLLVMILAQAAMSGLIGSGIGIGLCAVGGIFAERAGIPFRMMWFAPLVGCVGVGVVTLVAAAVSLWPVLRVEPACVFAQR